MSMLAERKQKQKWSLNPRGKEWSEDTSKFGFKMLEKMGWSKGKGLGAKEDGVTEHIKVSHKADSKGLGFNENNEQWTKHDVEFNDLLQTLSTNTCEIDIDYSKEITKVNSLEKKSQKSRVRVHYHKFTRGKDLSRYSAKDLANIFGKKSLPNTCNNSQLDTKEELSTIDDSNFECEFTESKKKKLKNNKNEDIGITNLAFDDNINKVNGFVEQIIDNDKKLKHKKKKSKKDKENLKEINDEINVEVDESISMNNNDKCEKKKKKIKDETTEDECLGLSNPGFDPMVNNESAEGNCKYEITSKKNKKSKKKETNDIGVTNPVFNLLSSENEIQNNKYEMKEKKKAKKNEIKDLGINNVAFDPISMESCIENNTMEIEIKKEKKKKLKKNKDESLGLHNLAFDPLLFNDECEKEINTFEDNVINKNKRKRKLQEISEEISNNKHKDKKKIKKQTEYNGDGLETPNIKTITNESQSEGLNNLECCDITLNVTTTPIIKKPKINSNSTTNNKNKLKRKNVRFSNITQEHIIPNNDDLRLQENGDLNLVEENVISISNKLDGYQAELENDMNEAKIMVGIVGNEQGENEKLEDGILLKYKYAKFGKEPAWRKKDDSNAKKSYKHLIKGDIHIGFKNTNLHTIKGYAY